MEKNISDNIKDFVSKAAMAQLNTNDKTIGTSVALEAGMRLKLLSADYIPNIRTYESAQAATDDGVASTRQQPQADGTVKVDNSYYAIVCDGDVRHLSLRALTSWAQLEDVPEGIMKIASGKASSILNDVKPYIGKTVEVVAREEWEADDEHKGRRQRFAGSAIALKVVG